MFRNGSPKTEEPNADWLSVGRLLTECPKTEEPKTECPAAINRTRPRVRFSNLFFLRCQSSVFGSSVLRAANG
jgi:hypothetical protein